MLITISGAHKSGKTTLANEVHKTLTARTCRLVHLLPSYSHALIEHCQFLGVTCYDDINKLGLRPVFQTLISAKLFEQAKKIIDLHAYNKDSIVIVDRWFADAYSYGVLELGPEIRSGWVQTLKDMNLAVKKSFASYGIKETTLVINYEEFGIVEEKKTRATLDPRETTNALLDWFSLTGTQFEIISNKKLDKRVAIVLHQAGLSAKE